jgi:hypothetical protein
MARRGAVAEWLGRGLQSLVHQFDSGRRLSGASKKTSKEPRHKMATRPMPMPRPPRAAAENQRAATTPPSTIIAAAILPGLGPFQGFQGRCGYLRLAMMVSVRGGWKCSS